MDDYMIEEDSDLAKSTEDNAPDLESKQDSQDSSSQDTSSEEDSKAEEAEPESRIWKDMESYYDNNYSCY